MYSQLKWGGGKRLQGDVVGMLSLEEESFGKQIISQERVENINCTSKMHTLIALVPWNRHIKIRNE